MATLIEKIAEQVSSAIPGVDWEELEERFGMPREKLVYHSDTTLPPGQTGVFAYDVYIDAARARAEVQLNKIQLSFQVEDNPNTELDELTLAMNAWDEVQNEANTVGDAVLRALRTGKAFLSSENEYVVEREHYRAVISATYLICLYGSLVHSRKLMQLEDIPGEEIVKSAQILTQTLNGIAMLGEMGALGVLRPPATGFSAPAVVAVAISSALAVGIICFTIVTMQEQASFNRNVRLVCEDAIARGDENLMERCRELLKMSKLSQQGGPFGAAASSVGQAALMVAGAILLVALTPTIVRLFPKKRRGAYA